MAGTQMAQTEAQCLQGNAKFSDGPLFVVGLPRSGTTLLYTLLNQHPQIALMQEGELPLLWPLFWMRRRKSEWLERWNFFTGSLERHPIDLDRIPAFASSIRMATEAAYKEYARQKGAYIWGDKCPSRYDSLLNLADEFPNARFVIIWRDPTDVCRSIIRARKESPFFSGLGATHRIFVGCEKMGLQRNELLRRGAPVHELSYQTLVQDTRSEMLRLCEFLGVPFDHRMTSLEGGDRSALHPGDHNALVKGEKISARKRPGVLPNKLNKKIDRYKRFWRSKAWNWAGFFVQPEPSGVRAGLFERTYDQLFYLLLRCWDFAIVLVYCFAPLSILRAYRASKVGNRYLTWMDYVRARTSEAPPPQ
jgi:hypothetical protein